MNVVSRLNLEIETTKPWELLKQENQSKLIDYLQKWITDLSRIAIFISPIVPRAATGIQIYIAESSVELKPLFPRI